MARPADFFIGIIDFFAVVLPGAILTALVMTEAPGLVDTIVGDVTGGTAVAVVAVSSYVLGQVAFAAGSAVLDRPYDRWVAKRRDRTPDVELERARELATKELGSDEDVKQISLHRWAEARVRLRSPVAATAIDRAEAESKFFRTLSVVLAAAAVSGFLVGDGILLVITGGLVPLTVQRSFILRHKSSTTVYRYYLALTSSPGDSEDTSSTGASAAR